MPTDIETARAKKAEPIAEVAARIDIPGDALIPYGRGIANIDTKFARTPPRRRRRAG